MITQLHIYLYILSIQNINQAASSGW